MGGSVLRVVYHYWRLHGTLSGALSIAGFLIGLFAGSSVLLGTFFAFCQRIVLRSYIKSPWTWILYQNPTTYEINAFCYTEQMLHSNFIIIGTILGALGSIVYLIDTVKGKVKPNRVSFLLWSIVPFIAFAAQIKQGVGLEALMTFSTGFLPLTVFIASFVNKEAEWKLTKFDLLCGILSIVGLILWLITKVGNVAIFFSIVADGLAAIPTIVKAYKYPDTEIAWPWVATSVGVTLTLLTLSNWTFANSGFIIYIFLVNTLIWGLVQFRIGEKLT